MVWWKKSELVFEVGPSGRAVGLRSFYCCYSNRHFFEMFKCMYFTALGLYQLPQFKISFTNPHYLVKSGSSLWNGKLLLSWQDEHKQSLSTSYILITAGQRGRIPPFDLFCFVFIFQERLNLQRKFGKRKHDKCVTKELFQNSSWSEISDWDN